MNTGIQDSINLGRKLATALRNEGCERLLDSYHLERHPTGAQVVALTTQITMIGYVGHLGADTRHANDLYRRSFTADASPSGQTS